MAPALSQDYSYAMNNKQYFFKAGKAGIVLNTAVLITAIGFVGYADGQGLRINVTPPVITVAPPAVVAPSVVVGAPVVVAEDNYVYYPSYGVYYNTSRHQYAYMDGGAWVSRPAPMGVSADVLLASPSVKMDFHDSPANHHEAMVRKYPKNYREGRPDQKTDGREDHRDEHRDK